MEVKPTCNIYTGQCELKIPPGHERCFQCDGVGCFYKDARYKNRFIRIVVCPQCNGKGYIDWIANIRKERKYVSSYSCKTDQVGFKCGTMKSCKVIKRWAKQHRR